MEAIEVVFLADVDRWHDARTTQMIRAPYKGELSRIMFRLLLPAVKGQNGIETESGFVESCGTMVRQEPSFIIGLLIVMSELGRLCIDKSIIFLRTSAAGAVLGEREEAKSQ